MVQYSNYQDILFSTNFVGGAGKDDLSTVTGSSDIRSDVSQDINGVYQFYYYFLTSLNDLNSLGYYDTPTTDIDNESSTVDREYFELPSGNNPSLSVNQITILSSILNSSAYGASFSDVAKVNFNQGDTSNTDIVVGQTTSGNGITDTVGGYEIDYSTSSSSLGIEGKHGDIWLNEDFDIDGDNQTDWSSTSKGNYNFYIILHELGHSLGLAGDENIPQAIDSHKHTVMSYKFLSGMNPSGIDNDVLPSGLQLLDIAAIQEIYGRNWDTRNEDLDGDPNTNGTTYSKMTAFASTRPNDAFIYTIWDGGGSADVIDASDYLNTVLIDLRQGNFSSIGKTPDSSYNGGRGEGLAIDNVAVAYHSVIENAIGTAQHDTIIGNAWSNVLEGGAGDDTIYGSGYLYDNNIGFGANEDNYDRHYTDITIGAFDDSGNDTFISGEGNDAYVGGAGFNTIDYSTDPININGSGVGLTADLTNVFTGTLSFYGTITDGHGDADLVYNVQNYIGTSGADEFRTGHGFLYTEFAIDAGDGLDKLIFEASAGGHVPSGIGIADRFTHTHSIFIEDSGRLTTSSGSVYENFEEFEYDGNGAYFLTESLGNTYDIDGTAALSYINQSSGITANLQTGSISNLSGTDDVSSTTLDIVSIVGTNQGDTFIAKTGESLTVVAGLGNDTTTFSDDNFGYVYAGGDDVILGNSDLFGKIKLPDGVSLSDLSVTYTYKSDVGWENSGTQNPVLVKLYDIEVDINGHGSILFKDQTVKHRYYDHDNSDETEKVFQYILQDNLSSKTFLSNNGEQENRFKLDDSIETKNINDIDFISDGVSSDNYSTDTDHYFGSDGVDVITLSDDTSETRQVFTYSGNDNVTGGNALREDIYLGFGNDTADGKAGDDYIHGGFGNDTLTGGTGNDSLYGGAGDDKFYYTLSDNDGNFDFYYGGSGNDTIVINLTQSELNEHRYKIDFYQMYLNDYANSSAVGTDIGFINLQRSNIGFDLNLDAIEIMEVYVDGALYTPTNIAFNGADPDNIQGSALADVTYGTLENDIIYSSAGSDFIDGREGFDTVAYAFASSGVDVDLSQNTASDNGEGGVDTFVSIENIAGSSFADTITGDNNANYLIGGAGNDTINGGLGADTISYSFAVAAVNVDLSQDTASDDGHGDVDTLSDIENVVGSYANDIIIGDNVVNFLYGEGGDDTLTGGDGNDNLYGGADTDKAVYAGNYADFTLTNQTSYWSVVDNVNLEGSDNLYDIETIEFADGVFDVATETFTSTSLNLIEGTASNETLNGTSGNDEIYGYAGNDQIYSEEGDDVVYGGDGNDTIYDLSGNDNYDGGGGTNDRVNYLSSNAAGIILDLAAGTVDENKDTVINDILSAIENVTATNHNDEIYGSSSRNVIMGQDGDDLIYGYGGNDDLKGLNDDDTIYGGDGNDSITGGSGTNTLYGEAGNDTFHANGGNDTIDGGVGGTDHLRYRSGTTNVMVDMVNGTADEGRNGSTDDTFINIRKVTGSKYDDQIFASSGAQIFGDRGDDELFGSTGNETIQGGNGIDTIYVSEGVDSIYGGNDADTFIFEDSSAFNGIDNIYDFDEIEGDVLDISDVLDGYDSATDDITDFVQITQSGNDSILSIDEDGTANGQNFVHLATLKATSGLTDEAALETSGNIIG